MKYYAKYKLGVRGKKVGKPVEVRCARVLEKRQSYNFQSDCIGVYLKDGDFYSLIDGYHRLAATPKNENVKVLVI